MRTAGRGLVMFVSVTGQISVAAVALTVAVPVAPAVKAAKTTPSSSSVRLRSSAFALMLGAASPSVSMLLPS